MNCFSSTVLRKRGVRMHYRGHYIIQHSRSTVTTASFAGFGRDPIAPGCSPPTVTTVFFRLLITHLLVWQAHDRASVGFLCIHLDRDLFKTVLVCMGCIFDTEGFFIFINLNTYLRVDLASEGSNQPLKHTSKI